MNAKQTSKGKKSFYSSWTVLSVSSAVAMYSTGLKCYYQTKTGKVYTRFQTKTAQKPFPMGPHIPT